MKDFAEQFVFKHTRADNSVYASSDYANDTEVVVTLNGEQNLTQILNSFEGFLQSVGFVFGVDDHLQVTNDHLQLTKYPQYELDEEIWDKNLEFNNNEIFGSDEEDTKQMSFSFNDPNEAVDDMVGLPTTNEEVEELINIHNVKLETLENIIVPFLQSLQSEPEKTQIHWPNRTNEIQGIIDEILTITRIK